MKISSKTFTADKPVFTIPRDTWNTKRNTELTSERPNLDFIKFRFSFDNNQGLRTISSDLMNQLSKKYHPQSRAIKPENSPKPEVQAHTSSPDKSIDVGKKSQPYSLDPEHRCNKYAGLSDDIFTPSKEWCPLFDDGWGWTKLPKYGAQAVDGQGLTGTGSPDPSHRPWNEFSQTYDGNCVSVAVIKAAMDKFGDDMYASKQPDGNQGFNLVLHNGAKIHVSKNEMNQAQKSAQLKGNPNSTGYKEAILAYTAIVKGKMEVLNNGFTRTLKSLGKGENVQNVAHYLGLKVHSISAEEAATADSAIKTGGQIIAPNQLAGRLQADSPMGYHALAIDNGKVDLYGKELDLGEDGFNKGPISYYDLSL